jgi:hypothetical protein
VRHGHKIHLRALDCSRINDNAHDYNNERSAAIAPQARMGNNSS